MRVGALILAAGNDRVGDLPKATMELSGTTVIKREIKILREAGISPIVVVAGETAEQLKKHVVHSKIRVVTIADAQHNDMLTSIQKGLSALGDCCDQVIILPVDIPAILPDTILQLVEANWKKEYDLTVPVYQGKPGHPILLQMNAAPKIAQYQGEGGIHAMIQSGQLKALNAEVLDPGIFIEINHPEDPGMVLDYDAANREINPIRPVVKVSLRRTKEFITREFIDFLRMIDGYGSMNSACQKMGMAYSRGWSMINQAEEQLGFPLIERLTGGKGGGSSTLTVDAQKLIKKYEEYSEKLEAEADRIYKEIFEDDPC